MRGMRYSLAHPDYAALRVSKAPPTDGPHELYSPNLMRPLREDEFVPHPTLPRLDVAQDRVARFAFV